MDRHLAISGVQTADVIDVRPELPSSWQPVRRYDLADLARCGYPCLVGSRLALFYLSTTDPLKFQIGQEITQQQQAGPLGILWSEQIVARRDSLVRSEACWKVYRTAPDELSCGIEMERSGATDRANV